MEKLKFDVEVNLDLEFDEKAEKACTAEELQQIIKAYTEDYILQEITGFDSRSSVTVKIK